MARRSNRLQPGAWRGLLVGGVLPVLAFVVVEEVYGPMAGALAGMVFGLGEVWWEWWRYGRVEKITWISTGLLFVLGAISFWEGEGVFFKLQPAVMLFVLAIALGASSFMKKPLLLALARRQNSALPREAEGLLGRINGRLAVFMLLLAGVSTHAALYWSTRAWALLKSAGLPVLLFLYLGGEFGWLWLAKRRAHPYNG